MSVAARPALNDTRTGSRPSNSAAGRGSPQLTRLRYKFSVRSFCRRASRISSQVCSAELSSADPITPQVPGSTSMLYPARQRCTGTLCVTPSPASSILLVPRDSLALDHDVDQPPWYVDHLARLAAGDRLGDLGLGQDACWRFGFGQIDRQQQAVAHLAVDLDHDFDRVVLGQRRVVAPATPGGGPSRASPAAPTAPRRRRACWAPSAGPGSPSPRATPGCGSARVSRSFISSFTYSIKRGDHGVELELVQIGRSPAGSSWRADDRSGAISCVRQRSASNGAGAGLGHQSVGAADEALHAGDAADVPRAALVPGPEVHQVQAQRVGAVLRRPARPGRPACPGSCSSWCPLRPGSCPGCAGAGTARRGRSGPGRACTLVKKRA